MCRTIKVAAMMLAQLVSVALTASVKPTDSFLLSVALTASVKATDSKSVSSFNHFLWKGNHAMYKLCKPSENPISAKVGPDKEKLGEICQTGGCCINLHKQG